MKNIYTATFEQFDGDPKFYARVPDLPGCATSGKDLAEAIAMITDAANLWIISAEDHDDPVLAPSDQNDIPLEPGMKCSYIQIDTFAYRAAHDTRAVRKNVSLPHWMAELADKQKINCSQVLQDALLAKFT
ncbi:MAG: type II toxin-antitoxin system HicB family antitoxin [Lachnospiraceae bacterium]|nr:type II toxin-antitoxin system HicB family antitoxin [Lachnospiraceae bacterium]